MPYISRTTHSHAHRHVSGGMSASGLSALSSMLGLAKRKDVGKQEAIEGQVRVTTAKKDGPDFGDLKLAQCLQVGIVHSLLRGLAR